MNFSKNFYELFIKPEDDVLEWGNKIEELIKNNDVKGLENLLDTAKEIYVEERQIYTAIDAFTLETKSIEEKKRLLDVLKEEDFVEYLNYSDSAIKMKLKNGLEIKATKLTELIPNLKNEDIEIVTERRGGQCHKKSIKISKSMGIDNNVVTGFVYGITDKNKYLHSWVEFGLNGEEMVIDYTLNLLINKDGYYYMQHVEPISKISDKDLVEDMKYIRKFSKLGCFNIKEYLVYRDEIIRSFQKNKTLFEDEER